MTSGRMRETFAEAVVDLARADDRLVFVSADCGGREREFFRTEGRGRLVETGIAEANSAVIAAGLAAEGLRPYLLNFAYLLGRMYNQLSQSIAVDGYPVHVAGYYAGVWGVGGRSHNCVTDLSIMRALPGFSIYAPADAWETRTLVERAHQVDGPTYLRLSGVPTPTVFSEAPGFRPVRRLASGRGVTLFCHGTMVAECLRARELGALDASVVSVSQIKPLPAEEILAEVRRTGRAVVVEEHSAIGGLAEAIAALLIQEHPVPMKVLAVPDRFPWSARMDLPDLYARYGLSAADIVAAVRELGRGDARPAAPAARRAQVVAA